MALEISSQKALATDAPCGRFLINFEFDLVGKLTNSHLTWYWNNTKAK